MIKAQRFWSKAIQIKVKEANDALKTKNFPQMEEIVDELIEDLKDQTNDWRDRVAICFIVEQISKFDPLIGDRIVDGLMAVLNSETTEDPHVKEFAVWALGKIVEDTQSLDLVKLTMPIIVKFLNDDSEQVQSLATELHSRLSEFMKEKATLDEQLSQYRDELLKVVNIKLAEMKIRSDEISREALALNYQAAFERQDEMKTKIRQFSQMNQQEEDEIITLEKEYTQKMKAFTGESREIIKYWRTQRGEKEDLIRRVECILRIQSKIHGIIQFILSKAPKGSIDLDEIKEITKARGRPYGEREIIEILQQLVDEEIIPNFMVEQIKDFKIKVKDFLPEKEQSQEPVNDK